MMYAFIHMAKTGGSTIRHVLRCSFGAGHCDIKVPPQRRRNQPWILPRDIRIARRVYPTLKGICGHRVTCFTGLEEECGEIRYFTFLRDPYRRFVSHFNHHLRDANLPCTADTLRDFATDPNRQNIMTRMLCGQANGAAAIENLHTHKVFVGLTQHFDESFCLFAQWLGSAELQSHFLTLNQAPRPSDLPVPDPELSVLIHAAIEEDQRVYQHVVDHVFPRQRREYRGDLENAVNELRKRNQCPAKLKEPGWAKIKRGILYKPLIHCGLGNQSLSGFSQSPDTTPNE